MLADELKPSFTGVRSYLKARRVSDGRYELTKRGSILGEAVLIDGRWRIKFGAGGKRFSFQLDDLEAAIRAVAIYLSFGSQILVVKEEIRQLSERRISLTDFALLNLKYPGIGKHSREFLEQLAREERQSEIDAKSEHLSALQEALDWATKTVSGAIDAV